MSFLSSKSTLEVKEMQRTCCYLEMAAITCYQSTLESPCGLKTLVTSLVCFPIALGSCRVAVDFFCENEFLYKGRNDVTISQT